MQKIELKVPYLATHKTTGEIILFAFSSNHDIKGIGYHIGKGSPMDGRAMYYVVHEDIHTNTTLYPDWDWIYYED